MALGESIGHEQAQDFSLLVLPEQACLLLPPPIDWLPKDHLAFFLLDLIDQLDLVPRVKPLGRWWKTSWPLWLGLIGAG
jgi:hypothetical protein